MTAFDFLQLHWEEISVFCVVLAVIYAIKN